MTLSSSGDIRFLPSGSAGNYTTLTTPGDLAPKPHDAKACIARGNVRQHLASRVARAIVDD